MDTACQRGGVPLGASIDNLCQKWLIGRMATMNISLPDPMKQWIEAQASTGRYSNVSDFVRDLVRREQERRDKLDHMQRLVDAARASGLSDETMADIRTRVLRDVDVMP